MQRAKIAWETLRQSGEPTTYGFFIRLSGAIRILSPTGDRIDRTLAAFQRAVSRRRSVA